MDRLRQDPNTGFYDLPSDFWAEAEDEFWDDEPEDEEPEELDDGC